MRTTAKIIIATIMLLSWSIPALASFQTEMKSMFNSMTNVTSPSSYLDQRRGVYNAGAVTVKNRITELDLFAVNPPSIDAGCGGIDAYMGSFSFVNADQIVQMLRSIGSNASGYFFKIALQAACPSCEATMSQLSQTIQQMNDALGNSCQIAQGAVNALMPQSVMDRAAGAEKAKAAQWAKLGGIGDDFQAFMNDLGKDRSNMNSADPAILKDKKITGNMAWRILHDESDNGKKMLSLFANASVDPKDFARMVMSITGTQIIKPPADPKGLPDIKDIEPILSLADIMGESNKRIEVHTWACMDDYTDCLTVDKDTDTTILPTFVNMVHSILLGGTAEAGISGASPDGIAGKFLRNTDAFNSLEKSFMDAMPEVGKRIRDLAIYNPGGLRTYVAKAEEAIALEMASSLFEEIINTMRYVASVMQYEQGPAFIAQLNTLEQKIQNEADTLRAKIATDTQLHKLYYELMQSGRKYNLNNFLFPLVSGSQTMPAGGATGAAAPVGSP